MAQTQNRWLVRNRKLRAENDYNRVMHEYIAFKYDAVKQEVDAFYNNLRDKYPDKTYKGSKAFRTWVLNEIKSYVMENTSMVETNVPDKDIASDEVETSVMDEGVAPDEEQQLVNRGDVGTDVLSEALDQTGIGENQSSFDADVMSLDNMDKLIDGMIKDLEMDIFQDGYFLENDDPPVEWW